MAHPLVWSKKSFFNPIGNTPATEFTRHLAPVLLLGCGDARSILYAVLMDLATRRNWNVAIMNLLSLPRNILLYTLLMEAVDDKIVDMIWNTHHHFYLDRASLNHLVQHCQKLIDLSTSLEQWNAHRYGQLIEFCTNYTFLEIRRHWELYLVTDALLPMRREHSNLHSYQAYPPSGVKQQTLVTFLHHRDAQDPCLAASRIWDQVISNTSGKAV